MAEDRVSYRALTAHHRELLVSATLGNLNWCGPRFDRHDVVTRKEFLGYTDFRPSRGDFGIVASTTTGQVAVGWALFLPADDAGYGFVGEHTPEFSLWVESRLRGHGIGRDVTERLLDEAVSRGLDAVSLSVEPENARAVRLYRSMGFVDVAGREDDGVMVWTRPVTGRRRSRTPE